MFVYIALTLDPLYTRMPYTGVDWGGGGYPRIQHARIRPPSVQLPSVQLPSVQLPSVQLPSVQLPSVQLPSVQLPSVQLPSTYQATEDTTVNKKSGAEDHRFRGNPSNPWLYSSICPLDDLDQKLRRV
jgi:hypothetical protein